MALLEIRWQPTTRELRQFGALLAVFFCGLAVWHRAAGWPWLAGLMGGAVIAAGLAWLRPGWLRPVYVGWMCVAFPIGWVVSHVLLAGIYYLLFTPVGCVLRWTGYDPLRRRWDAARESYWEPRPTDIDPKTYFRQF